VQKPTPSTLADDLDFRRGHERSAAYSTPNGTYLIVYRDKRRIIRHYRAENDAWFDAYHAGEGSVPFPCPELALTLAQIYEGVELTA
jgi:hypothetical protein